MTLQSYIEMLRFEDRIKDHDFYLKAAKVAIKVYLTLHDKPPSSADDQFDTNMAKLTPSESKKLKNKQKKQQIKAEQEKEKLLQIELKKKELNKQKNKEDNGDIEQTNEEELSPEKLEQV
jgi:hypothetical protein